MVVKQFDKLSGRARVVGIAEMAISKDSSEILVTHSLGSCIGLTLFDPTAGIGALAHFMLPCSKRAGPYGANKTATFVDTGLMVLLEQLLAEGVSRDSLVVMMAGGASPLDCTKRLKIGERNCTVARKFLWKNGIVLAGQEVGGNEARTLRLYMGNGMTTVTSTEEHEIQIDRGVIRNGR